MKYYGWGGKEDGKLTFIIQEIKRLKGKSKFHTGYRITDMGDEIYSNVKGGPKPGTEIDVEVVVLNIFDNTESNNLYVP